MSFKTFDLAHDVASMASAVNEVVSVSSSLYYAGANVKLFSNIAGKTGGYWQSVFDSSPSSSQSTPLFDMTFGFHATSSYNVPAASGNQQDEKVKVYRQMASMLLGDPNSRFSPDGLTNWNEAFFIMVKRGIMKDELKKGTIEMFLEGENPVTASDLGAATSFKQTVGGDYANLVDINDPSSSLGLVFYNAGIVVLSTNNTTLNWNYQDPDIGLYWRPGIQAYALASGSTAEMKSGSIDDCVTGLRMHMPKIAFHNQTNLYSTVYFCRATNTEFNYSSNPTYLDESSRIRVTSGSNVLQSRTYITTIGLYDASDNLLAVGKVNKPITKSPDTESIFRIRLDY